MSKTTFTGEKRARVHEGIDLTPLDALWDSVEPISPRWALARAICKADFFGKCPCDFGHPCPYDEIEEWLDDEEPWRACAGDVPHLIRP